MIEYLAFGIGLGLAAGFSPGPLLALVIAQAVRHGTGEALKVAVAPLLTDLPIVAVCVVAMAAVSATGTALVQGVVALVGAAFVLYLGVETARSRPPEADASAPPPAHSWRRGAMVNALSPHPWLFWLAVGAPLLVRAWTTSAGAAAAFLAGFYACLVGSKVLVAVVVGRSARFLRGRAYRVVLVVLGLVLVVFAALLTREGIGLIRGA